jgi:hypothetical protein
MKLNLSAITLPLILFSIPILDGCGGTWVGNPGKPPNQEEDPKTHVGEGEVNLSIAGKQADAAALTAFPVAVTGKDGQEIGSILLSEARIVLKNIRIKPVDQSIGLQEKYEGPYLVDLIKGVATPSLDTVVMPAGVYKDIELTMHKMEDGDSFGLKGAAITDNSSLLGKSIEMSGTYTPADGGNSFRITFSSEVGEEFSVAEALGKDAVITVDANTLNDIAVLFRFEEWFRFDRGSTVDFSELQGNTVLSDNSDNETEKKIQETIRENIKKSADYEDN